MSYAVTLTTDRSRLHAFMQVDPIWAAYAIGDLEPVHFAWCTWYLAEDAAGQPAGLVLLYRRLNPPVLLTMGQTAAIAAILQQITLPDRISMSAQEAHLPLLQERYDFCADRVRPMLRMTVTPDSFLPATTGPGETVPALRRLGAADVPAIEALIAQGGPFAPDAFMPSQVDEGVFFGIEAAGGPGMPAPRLWAVAGTHLMAPAWGVAAVGNVYVHPAQRGRGYGAQVSSAVTADLLQRGLRVVLNVDQDNLAAISLYRQLGFAVHCPFVEGNGAVRNA